MRAYMMRYGWLAFCLFITTIAVALLLILLGRVQQATNEKLAALQSGITPEPGLIDASELRVSAQTEWVMLPDTRIERVITFGECGHTVTSDIQPKPELIGMDREAVQVAYPDFRITSFSGEVITLRRTVWLYCPQHYMLKNVDGQIVLYCSTVDGELQKIKTIEVPLNHISNELYAELLKGKAYDSLLELEAALEDITT